MRRGALTGRRKDNRTAAIEMAPLIDMIFILLIFYIVSTSFLREAGVNVDRPESESAERIDEHFLPVAITKSGSVHVAGNKIASSDWSAITDALGRQATGRVVIQADRDVPTWLLLEVMDTCKFAGAERVDVAAMRE